MDSYYQPLINFKLQSSQKHRRLRTCDSESTNLIMVSQNKKDAMAQREGNSNSSSAQRLGCRLDSMRRPRPISNHFFTREAANYKKKHSNGVSENQTENLGVYNVTSTNYLNNKKHFSLVQRWINSFQSIKNLESQKGSVTD